ncbi:MAG: zinc-binding dehydrogenase [Proteobacteria bacterium]|nr:zinc-binding dehydrogenase [Pseudomonadota bacterium]
MKALRKLESGSGQVAVVEVPDPDPGRGQVRIRVMRGGICGTDLHIYHGLFSKVRPPVTLGHELAGTIDALGPGVDHWNVGDRVTAESEAFSCGQCRWCRAAMTNICPERLALGYGVDGGFATFVCTRASALHRLPETIGFDEGALSEPLTVAVHAVEERAEMKTGAWVLVTGPGPVGLLVLQVARAAGGRVIVSGTRKDTDRLVLAERLGAEAVILVDVQDPLERILEITGGRGIDTAFECSGVSAAAHNCIEAVRRRGEIVQVGLYGRPVSLELDPATMKEVQIKGAFTHTHATWRRAMDLLAGGAVDLRPLVSGTYPLNAWETAFGQAEVGAGIKYLIDPQDAG